MSLVTKITQDLFGAYLMNNLFGQPDPHIISRIKSVRYGREEEFECHWTDSCDGFHSSSLNLHFSDSTLNLTLIVPEYAFLSCNHLRLIGQHLAATHAALGNELIAVADEIMNAEVVIDTYFLTEQGVEELRPQSISSIDEWVDFATHTLEPLIDEARERDLADEASSMSWEDDASGSDTDFEWRQFLVLDEQ